MMLVWAGSQQNGVDPSTPEETQLPGVGEG